MNRILLRIVTLIVLPGLILDPAWAASHGISSSPVPKVTCPVFQEEAFIERAVPYLHSLAWEQKFRFDQWVSEALVPGIREFPKSLRRDFLSRWHRERHPAQVVAWGLMWTSMAAAALSVFYGIPGWTPSSHGFPIIAHELFNRVSLSNIAVHTIYNSIAPHFGWPLLMIDPGSAPDDFWTVRTGEGFGKLRNRDLTEAESDLQGDLALTLHDKYGVDLEHADELTRTLLMLKGDELKMLLHYKILTGQDGLLLVHLKDGPLAAPLKTQLIETLVPRLAELYKSYRSQLEPVSVEDRRRGVDRDSNFGFDEGMLSEMLSSHLLPWPEVRRLQRTYLLGRDLAMVREALSYSNVEAHIRERQTLKLQPGGRAEIHQLYREPKPVTILERKIRAMRLQKEFEDRLEVLDYLKTLSGTKLVYEKLQKVTDQAVNVWIPGSGPIPLHRGQTVKFSSQYDLDFIVSGIDSENRFASLVANSGAEDPVSMLAQTGEILLNDDRGMEEKEESFLKGLLRDLKAYMSAMPTLSDNYNSLLGLTSSVPRDPPDERRTYEAVRPLKYLDERFASNISQATAVQMSFDPPRLLSIQGPAATTKTAVGVEIANQWVRRGKRVLYISQSHAAVDEAGSRMKEQPIIRVGRHPENFDPKKNLKEFWPGGGEERTVNREVLDELARKRQKLSEEIGMEAGYVVLATNAGIVTDPFADAVRHKKFPEYDLDFNEFDIIIMDEASRESLQGALLPLQYLKETGKLVVLGDTRQIGARGLGPLAKAFRKAYRQVKTLVDNSEITRLIDIFGENFQGWLEDSKHMDVPRITLTTNYRQTMLNAFMTSEVSYNNEVHIRGFEDFNEYTLRIADLADLGESESRPRYFEIPEETEDGISFYNEASMQWDIKLVQEYRKRFGPDFRLDQITIATPYIPQVLRLLEALQKTFPGEMHLPVVTTINSYQGGQNKYLIVDLVRSNGNCDIGLMRDPGMITVAQSRDQLEKTIVCDTRMFYTRSALSIRDEAAPARLMLKKIVDFYVREVMPFYRRKKLTKKDVEPADDQKKDVPPNSLLDAILNRKADLMSAWDTHLLPVLTHVADVRHARDSYQQAREIVTEDGWPLGAWWWEMLRRWEEANWDQQLFGDRLIEDLGGRRKLSAEDMKAVRDWAAAARQRQDAAYEQTVAVVKKWAETIVLEESRDLESLQWLYHEVPSSPLRADVRNQFSEHVKISLDRWRGRVADLVAYEKNLAGYIERINALAPGMGETGLGPIIRAEDRQQYEDQTRETYAARVRSRLIAPGGPQWASVARYAAEDSKLLKKAIGQESISWGKNQLAIANGDIAKIRKVRAEAKKGFSMVGRTGSEESMASLYETLRKESDLGVAKIVETRLISSSPPDWGTLRDLYENESSVVRQKIQERFDAWGRGVIDRAGTSVEAVEKARVEIEDSIRAMNPEPATIHFDGSFLVGLRAFGKDRLSEAKQSFESVKPLKHWERDAVVEALYSQDIPVAMSQAFLNDRRGLRESVDLVGASGSMQAKVDRMRAMPLFSGMPAEKAEGFLKHLKRVLRPTLQDDLRLVALITDEAIMRMTEESKIPLPQLKGDSSEFLKESIARVADGSPAAVLAPLVCDLASIPDDFFNGKFSKIDVLTIRKNEMKAALVKRSQEIENKMKGKTGAELLNLQNLARGLANVNVIEAGIDMVFSERQVEAVNHILDTASSWNDAEIQMRAFFRSPEATPQLPAVYPKLQSGMGYVVSVGIMPDMFIYLQIAMERQLTRRFIESGEFPPDKELPISFADIRLADTATVEVKAARGLSPESFILNDYFLEMQAFLGTRLRAHYKMISQLLGPGGAASLSTVEGKIIWTSKNSQESVMKSEERLSFIYIWNDLRSSWSRMLGELEDAINLNVLEGTAHAFHTIYQSGDVVRGMIYRLYSPQDRAIADKGAKRRLGQGKNPLAPVVKLDLSGDSPEQRARRVFLEELWKTIDQHIDVYAHEFLQYLKTAEKMLSDMMGSHYKADSPNFVIVLHSDDLPFVPLETYLNSSETILITLNGDHIAKALDRWLWAKQRDGERKDDTEAVDEIARVRRRIAQKKIRIVEADLLMLSPEFLLRVEEISKQSKNPEMARIGIEQLLDSQNTEFTEAFSYVWPPEIKLGTGALVVSIFAIPALFAFAALTFERMAAKPDEENSSIPHSLHDSQWFRATGEIQNRLTPDSISAFFRKMMRIGQAFNWRHIHGYLQQFVRDDGQIIAAAFGGQYLYSGSAPLTTLVALETESKIDKDDPLTLWSLSFLPFADMRGLGLVPKDALAYLSLAVNSSKLSASRLIGTLSMKVIRTAA